jgi:hypothetical protein
MSALRDIRLITVQHLNLPAKARQGVIDVMNLIDATLDEEGWNPPAEVTNALRRLDAIIAADENDDEDLFDDEYEDDILDGEDEDEDEDTLNEIVDETTEDDE